MPMPPFYVESDVHALCRAFPYARVGQERSALAYLSRMQEDGRELDALLRAFPDVRYEPLEAHYALARAIAALDEKLLSDLVLHFTWRRVVWAAFLAAFRPKARFAETLERARPDVPHDQWLVDLALREIDDRDADPGPHQVLIRAIRESLPAYPRERIRLREWPVGEAAAQLQAARAAVAATYRREGADAALAELRQSPWSGFLTGPN